MKEIEIECPCCKAEIVIDPQSGRILAHKAYKEPNQSLDDFLKSEKSRNSELAEKFKAAKEREESKMDFLEKKFQRAKDNKHKLPEAPKPDIFWD